MSNSKQLLALLFSTMLLHPAEPLGGEAALQKYPLTEHELRSLLEELESNTEEALRSPLSINAFANDVGNVVVGDLTTGSSFTTGVQNTFVGAASGQLTSVGDNNTALGFQTLTQNTLGKENCALGGTALYNNISGDRNTATGYAALTTNTTGNDNTAAGHNTLQNNTGSNNTALGSQTMQANTSGNCNVGAGYSALYSNTTGANNTAVGNTALYSNTTGFSNVAEGHRALYSNTTGFNNTAIGQQAMYSNTCGKNNTALGSTALYNNTSGQQNVALGQASLSANLTGSNNAAIGFQALLKTISHENTAVGITTLSNNATGTHNTGVGFNTLNANRRGADNAALGYRANEKVNGNRNTAFGSRALQNNATGTNNIALGFKAGSALSTNESNDIYIGNIGAHRENQTIRIGTHLTHTACYIVGDLTLPDGSLYIPTGGLSIGGSNFTIDNNGNINTSNATSGTLNPYDLYVQHNLTVGNESRLNGSVYSSGINNHTLSGVVGLGYVNVGLDGDAKLGIVTGWTSSQRYKDDIRTLTDQNESFHSLRPVTFTYKEDPTKQLYFGLIAEEVAEIMPEFVVRDKQGRPDKIPYDRFVPLLVAESLQQHQRILELEKNAATQETLQAQLRELEAELTELKNALANTSKN